jgi:hypothetical protein
MLWLKAWKEVRFRFAITVLLSIYIIAVILGWLPSELVRNKWKNLSAAKLWQTFILAYGGLILPISAKILAGAGINAQTSMGMSRGFHGSMGFLLSLPVSRTHILATRAGAGLILMLIVGVASFAVAEYFLREVANGWAHFPNILVVACFFYAMAVWFSTIFDEFWAGLLGLLILGAIGGYSSSLPGTWFDLASYLLSPTPFMPAGQTFFLITLTALQLAAARWIVENKEY